MAAIDGFAVGLQLAGLRPSSLNASGLIVEGRSTTLSRQSILRKADIRQCKDGRTTP
jgi:hypothetical protein